MSAPVEESCVQLEATIARWPDAGELFRAHGLSVARWARKLGGPGIDVEDVVQEVFLTVHRLLPGFRGEAQITTRMYRITENVVRHRRRRERVRRMFSLQPEVRAEPDIRLPDAELAQAQNIRLVYRVLDRLSEKSRTLIILFELDERSGEEIAELMGAKPQTVWVWLHRARAQFLREMKALQKVEA
jgi:RNA polymerase sigma-70 factor (ECF subfamily)